MYGNFIDITDEELIVGDVRAFIQSFLKVEACSCGVESIIPRLRTIVIETIRCVPMPDDSIDAPFTVE